MQKKDSDNNSRFREKNQTKETNSNNDFLTLHLEVFGHKASVPCHKAKQGQCKCKILNQLTKDTTVSQRTKTRHHKKDIKIIQNTQVTLSDKEILPSKYKDLLKAYIFDFSKPLGSGGNGTVYPAKRRSDNLSVVVKQIPKSGTKIEIDLLSEVKFLKRLRGVNGIVQIIDYCDSPQDYLIVMDTMDNCMDLFSFLNNQDLLYEDTIHYIFKQTIVAVETCLRKGIVHTDLKTENIIINTMTHNIKLIDFGGSKTARYGHYKNFSGTIHYAPPEVLVQNIYTAQGIISWTMGTILYKMVCGDIPFSKPNEIFEKYENYEKDMTTDIISTRQKEISSSCIHLITKCLQRQEKFRYKVNQIRAHAWVQYGKHTDV